MNLRTKRAAYAARLDEGIRRLPEILSHVEGIRRVSLFGSCAAGRRDLFTDLDVLVVWETDMPVLARLKALYAHLDVRVDLDLVCYTPAEFRELRDEPFLRRIMSQEVVLFEKKSP